MLWYKSWLDTRWRFLIGLALLACAAAAVVFTQPRVIQLLPMVPTTDVGGELGRRLKETMEVSRQYRGYIWSQWFRQTPTELGTLFAVLLGTGNLPARSTGGSALFTLSLPVSRRRLVTARAGTGLAELLLLAIVPSLLIPLLSPSIGQTYGIVEALLHGVCLFVTGTVFFSLALLLSTMFADNWRPMLIAVAVAVALGAGELLFGNLVGRGIFGVMSGDDYFRTSRLPWSGLVVSAAASAAFLYGALVNITHRDF